MCVNLAKIKKIALMQTDILIFVKITNVLKFIMTFLFNNKTYH